MARANDWAKENGLELAPAKTVAILFSTKKTENVLIPDEDLKVDGRPVPLSSTAKYLGLTVDKELNWKKHVDNKICSAKRLIFMLKSTVGKLWGPSPWAMKWAYEQMVVPLLTYGCYIWGQQITYEQKQDFKSLQRLALMMMGNFRKGTPGDGLDIITNTLPLDLKIKELMLNTANRLQDKVIHDWAGKSYGKLLGHIKYNDMELDKVERMEDKTTDTVDKRIIWERNFSVDTDSFTHGDDNQSEGIIVYTDGSRLNGKVGLGTVVTYGYYRPETRALRLNAEATVFQAETYAYVVACNEIRQYIDDNDIKDQEVHIMSDSQAGIKALISDHTASETVKMAIEALNYLGRSVKITIHYIKAHVGHDGNEQADKEAKAGTEREEVDLNLPIPKSYLKEKIRKYVRELWSNRWQKSSDCRQTKIWFDKPNPRKSKEVMKLRRSEISVMVRMVTGHNHLRRQNNLLGLTESKLCRLCGESEETSSHIITDCDALWSERADHFQEFFLCPDNPKWEVKQLISFLKVPRVAYLEENSLDSENDQDTLTNPPTHHTQGRDASESATDTCPA
jgi:ribonuclease HI